MNGLSGRRVRPRPMNFNERMPVIRTHSRDDRVQDSGLEAFLMQEEEGYAKREADVSRRSRVAEKVWGMQVSHFFT